jgi:hypothetical protein
LGITHAHLISIYGGVCRGGDGAHHLDGADHTTDHHSGHHPDSGHHTGGGMGRHGKDNHRRVVENAYHSHRGCRN